MRTTTIDGPAALALELPAGAPTRPGLARATGRALTGLAVLFLLFDGLIKLTDAGPVGAAFASLGMPIELGPAIALLQLVCLALYLIPSTSALGAVLLTGFLGGAVSLHLRVGNPLFSHLLFPTYVGALLWAGVLLRDDRIRRALLAR